MSTELKLFTTVRLEGGECKLLPLHLDLLQGSAKALGFAFDRAALEEELRQAAGKGDRAVPHKLRVTLYTDGTRTYDRTETLLPDNPYLTAVVWPGSHTNSRNPLLGHKVTHRPYYDPAVRAAQSSGFVDALFRNENGVVTEGAVHSIFIRNGEKWHTAPLSAGVLPGVFRRFLLETSPDITEAEFRLEDLLSADEVWLTNALRGVRKVKVVQPTT